MKSLLSLLFILIFFSHIVWAQQLKEYGDVKKQDFDDHRTCFRTLMNQQIIITLVDQESSVETVANCRDISDNGLAVEINHPVDIGTLLKIQLDNDDQMSIPLIDCQGRVIRCEQESDTVFLLAVELIDSQ